MAEIICIVCPMGCRIEVTNSESGIRTEGQGCKRGEAYAREEILLPRRVLTSVVAVAGRHRPLPVKTAGPIPKSQVMAAMAELREIEVAAPVGMGAVIVENLAGTGVALVAAGKV